MMNRPKSEQPKPITYALSISEGCFGNDTAGLDSTNPFIPFHVGDYIDRDLNFMPNHLNTNEVFRVTAIKHYLQEFTDEITQHVHICVERTKRPE